MTKTITEQETAIYDVCTECLYASEYGVTTVDGEWFVEGSDIPADCEPLSKISTTAHICSTTGPHGYASGGFSWRSCEGCGSRLGGERFYLAVTE